MIYLVETEMLSTLDESQLKELTAKDRLILVSFEGDQLPVSVFQILSGLRAKFEIKELPRTGDKQRDEVILAYTFGRFAEQLKKDGKICIFSRSFEFLVEQKNVAANLGILLGDEIKKRPYTKRKTENKKPETKEEKAPEKTPEKTPEKAPKETEKVSLSESDKKSKEEPKAPQKASKSVKEASKEQAPAKRKRLPDSLAKFLIKAGGNEVKDLVERKEDEIKTALSEATDPKIGLKTKLQLMLLGESGWEKIWEILAENFYEARIKYVGKSV